MKDNKNVPVEEPVSEPDAAPAAEAAVEHAPMLTPEQIHGEIKPLSSNGFVAFWQKIWRWWLGVWYGFSDRHPKFSKILYMVFFFIVFSEGVTIWQFIVMTFLPYAFGNAAVTVVGDAITQGSGGLWAIPFVVPQVHVATIGEGQGAQELFWALFNEPVRVLVDGKVWIYNTYDELEKALVGFVQEGKEYTVQCAGLGNFIAFEIAVFTAQVINFPLQRNITYRSKGNPYYQAMWYFIGWVLISIATNALWGIINPLMMMWGWNDVVMGLIKTVITGGLSMLVFFFIFMIIFPNVDKVAKKADARLEKAKAHGASEAKIAKLELKATRAHETALEYNTRCARIKAISLANTRAVSFEAAVKNLEKAQAAAEAAKGKSEEAAKKAQENLEACEARVPNYQQAASDAIDAKYKAMDAYVVALDEIISAMTARGEDTTKMLKAQSKLHKKAA